MSYQRIDRISEEVRREVDAIIREELHDPRISGTWSVTRAEVTGDLRYAKIYVSVLEDDKREQLTEALKKGMVKGIVQPEVLQPNPKKYAKKTYGVNQNAETIADVIATWMQDDK